MGLMHCFEVGEIFNDLPVQPLNQRPILGFGVADDDVVVGEQIDGNHLALRGEGFTAAGGAEDVGRWGSSGLQAVNHDEVAAESISAAVERARFHVGTAPAW